MPIRLVALAATVIVSSCGSSSSTTDEGPTFAELSEAFDAQNTRIAALPAATVLPPGTATYDGLARIDVITPEERVLIGNATLSADFSAGTVSGGVSRFVDSSEGAVDGSIAMTGGTISGVFIDGLAVNGNVDMGGRTIVFRGTGDGKFTGESGAAAIVQMGGVSGPDQAGWQGEAYLDRR